MTTNRNWRIIRVAGGMALCLMLPLKTEGQGHATIAGHAGAAVDTTILPGWQDFARYPTTGACLQAAWGTRSVLKRARWWADAYAPEHDTLPSAVVAIARSCGTRLSLQTVPASDLLDLVQLSLILGNDGQARTAAERYLASIQDPARRSWALLAVDTVYLYAHPMRLAIADTFMARLDSLGRVAAIPRFIAHYKLLQHAIAIFDTTRVEREVVAILRLDPDLTAEDREDYAVGNYMFNAVADLAFTKLYTSGRDAPAQTMKVVQSSGYRYPEKMQNMLPAIGLVWCAEHIGQPVPPLTATYWKGVDSSAHRWPVPGKVSIYVNAGEGSRELEAIWQRMIAKYGDAIAIVFRRKTQGYFHDSPPLTPAEEADRLGKYYLDYLKLPVRVAIETTPTSSQRLPDGRLMTQTSPTPLEKIVDYSFGLLMTDQTGKIVLAVSGFNERYIDAFVARTLGQGGTTARP